MSVISVNTGWRSRRHALCTCKGGRQKNVEGMISKDDTRLLDSLATHSLVGRCVRLEKLSTASKSSGIIAKACEGMIGCDEHYEKTGVVG